MKDWACLCNHDFKKKTFYGRALELDSQTPQKGTGNIILSNNTITFKWALQ